MQQSRGSPHSVLIIEPPSRKTVPIGHDCGQVANVMRGVIALRNQYVTKNEGCADIAHRQKLSAHESKAFVALGVIVIWQRAIVRLKPVSGVEGRWVAIDEGAVQFGRARTVMMVAQNFHFVRNQFSNATGYIRFTCRSR